MPHLLERLKSALGDRYAVESEIGRGGMAGHRTDVLRGALLAALTGFVWCGCSPDRASTTESVVTVLEGEGNAVLGLPHDIPAKFLVFLPLVTWSADGELEGRLARSWEHTPDYRTWTVHLRPDIRWHDGAPVTAHDVEFTLDLLKHPDVAWAAPDAYEVRVLDDTTYTITYRKRSFGNPLDTWTVYYPRHLLGGLEPSRFASWEFWTRPVGNGPYRFARLVPGTALELEANPDFYLGRPKLDRVILKLGGQALPELLSGNVDVIPYATEADLLKVAGDPRFRVYHAFDYANVRLVAWNQAHPALRDRRVRRALTLAIDRGELLRLLNLPGSTPIFDAPFSEDQLRRKELPPGVTYDPDEAASLLEQAGWQYTNGDSIRDRDGLPLEISALVAPMFGLDRAAVYIQSRLRRVGIRMTVETLDIGGLVARVRTRDFDAALLGMPVSGKWARASFFEEDSPIGYDSPDVRFLLRQLSETVDPAELDRIYSELRTIFQVDMPVTFLSPLLSTTIAHRRVRGLASPHRVDPVWHMEEVWIEDEP